MKKYINFIIENFQLNHTKVKLYCSKLHIRAIFSFFFKLFPKMLNRGSKFVMGPQVLYFKSSITLNREPLNKVDFNKEIKRKCRNFSKCMLNREIR